MNMQSGIRALLASKLQAAALAMGLAAATIVPAASADASALAAHTHTDGVTAVLVDAERGCSVMDGWETLNADWRSYGTIPISITTSGNLCSGKFSLADLQASGADTVILCMTAVLYRLTDKETKALQTYADDGHTILGVANVFQWKSRQNNGLAPIFGIAQQSTWYKDGLQGNSPNYQLQESDPDAGVDPLLGVTNPYVSSLYGTGEKPADKKWTSRDLAGGRYIGETTDLRNAVSVYDATNYTAFYKISVRRLLPKHS